MCQFLEFEFFFLMHFKIVRIEANENLLANSCLNIVRLYHNLV